MTQTTVHSSSSSSMTVLVMATVVTSALSSYPSYQDAKSLYAHLFTNYSKRVRPILNQSETVEVMVNFRLLNVMEVDNVRQKINLRCLIWLRWTDQLLTWDPGQFGGVRQLHPSPEEMWSPGVGSKEMGVKPAKLDWWTSSMLQHDGKVSVQSVGYLSIRCNLDMTFFPFDTQECFLVLAVQDHTETEVMLINDNITEKTVSLKADGQWEVKSQHSTRPKVSGMPPQTYSTTRVVLELRRLYINYVLSLLLPLVLLSLLTLLAFLVPISSGERASFALTGLLAQVVFLNLLSSVMPRSSDDTPLVMLLCLTLLGLSAAAVVMSVISLYIYHNHHDHRPSSGCSTITTALAHLVETLNKVLTSFKGAREETAVVQKREFQEAFPSENCSSTKSGSAQTPLKTDTSVGHHSDVVPPEQSRHLQPGVNSMDKEEKKLEVSAEHVHAMIQILQQLGLAEDVVEQLLKNPGNDLAADQSRADEDGVLLVVQEDAVKMDRTRGFAERIDRICRKAFGGIFVVVVVVFSFVVVFFA